MIQFHERQQAAIQDFITPVHRELCYDGGARSGKTFFVCYAIIQRCIDHHNSRHLVSRLRGNHLEITLWRQTLLPLLEEIFRDAPGYYKIDKVYRTIKFKNGSEIIGLALEDATRIQKVMGSEFSTVFINEATEISYGTYQALKTRCVQNIKGQHNKVIVDCNPTNQFHWIYQYFIQNLNPEDPDKKINAGRMKRRGPWLPTENPHLSNDAIEMIDSLSGTAHERLFQGLWVSSEGLVYQDYEAAIIEPFKLPSHFEITAAVDFGYSNPFGMLFFAYDHANETYYCFDEYYVREKTVKVHCEALKTLQSPWVDKLALEWIVADHDAEDRATMAENGFFTTPADKDIISGIDIMREHLKPDKKGYKVKIFRTCTFLLSEMAGYKYPEIKKGTIQDEKPVKLNDHLMDCLRYWGKRALKSSAIINLGRRGR